MDDLQHFERYEPRAWHDRGLVFAKLPTLKTPAVLSGRPWKTTLVISAMTVGLAISNSFAITATDSVEAVPLIAAHGGQRCGPDIDKRIRDLTDLKDGWYDGEGTAFYA